VILAVAAFFWIAKNLGGGESVESEKSAVVCRGESECFWTAHIHATVGVFQVETKIPVRFEQGELEGQHTHSESNTLHWHGLIPVDPKTKEVTDWSQLTILQLLKDLDLSIEDGPKIIVNGKGVDLSYVWEDGDTIEIRYAK
jgi:hypothetical protein